MTAAFNIALPGSAPVEPRPDFTPDTHPLRNVKPDPWMIRNARTTAENVARLTAAIDLTRKEPTR